MTAVESSFPSVSDQFKHRKGLRLHRNHQSSEGDTLIAPIKFNIGVVSVQQPAPVGGAAREHRIQSETSRACSSVSVVPPLSMYLAASSGDQL